MSVDMKEGAGSADSRSGGAELENPITKEADLKDQKKPDAVKYETFEKVLDQKKKRDQELLQAQARIAEFEQRERDREAKEAESKGDFQKLLKLRDEEIERSRGELKQIRETLTEGAKRNAVLSQINGQVDEQYYRLLDVTNVVVDPSTGMIDEASVQKSAREFEEQYSLVIKRQNAVSLPNQAPKGGHSSLSYEEWLKLPLKEMKLRRKDVKE